MLSGDADSSKQPLKRAKPKAKASRSRSSVRSPPVPPPRPGARLTLLQGSPPGCAGRRSQASGRAPTALGGGANRDVASGSGRSTANGHTAVVLPGRSFLA